MKPDVGRCAGRSTCRDWCGLTFDKLCKVEAFLVDWRGRNAFGSGNVIWCSETCRDLVLPPLGSTPAPLPSSTVGAPEGYVPCPKACGRWTSGSMPCWTCLAGGDPSLGEERRGHYRGFDPDWTPPTAAPPTREQILAEELAKPTMCLGSRICNWGHAEDCPLWTPGQKPTEAQERQIATVLRVRAHQLAEGGDSAVAKAPGRTPPKPWVSSVDPDHWIPDADGHSSRYRR